MVQQTSARSTSVSSHSWAVWSLLQNPALASHERHLAHMDRLAAALRTKRLVYTARTEDRSDALQVGSRRPMMLPSTVARRMYVASG